MGYVSVKRKDIITALAHAWELSINSWSTIGSFLTARTKKYYSCMDEVIEDLEQLNDKDLSKLFGSVYKKGNM